MSVLRARACVCVCACACVSPTPARAPRLQARVHASVHPCSMRACPRLHHPCCKPDHHHHHCMLLVCTRAVGVQPPRHLAIGETGEHARPAPLPAYLRACPPEHLHARLPARLRSPTASTTAMCRTPARPHLQVLEMTKEKEGKFSLVPYESGRYTFCLSLVERLHGRVYSGELTPSVVWDLHVGLSSGDHAKEGDTDLLWQNGGCVGLMSCGLLC